MCYHDEFGSSALKNVGINTGEPQILGVLELPLCWGVADRKIHATPRHVLSHQMW